MFSAMSLPSLDRNSIHYYVLAWNHDIHNVESMLDPNIVFKPIPGHSFPLKLIKFSILNMNITDN